MTYLAARLSPYGDGTEPMEEGSSLWGTYGPALAAAQTLAAEHGRGSVFKVQEIATYVRRVEVERRPGDLGKDSLRVSGPGDSGL